MSDNKVAAKEYHPRVSKLQQDPDALDTLLRAYDESREISQRQNQEARELRLIIMNMSDVISDLVNNLDTDSREYQVARQGEDLIPEWANKANNALMGWDD